MNFAIVQKIGLLLLSIALLLASGCARKLVIMDGDKKVAVPRGGKPTITYRDDKVVAGIKPPPFYPLNVHGSETTFLIVMGKRYNRVKGEEPYYLNVPQLDSILFVTEDGPDRATVHLVSLKTRREVRVDPLDEACGDHIGAAAGSLYYDWVERVENQTLVLGSVGMNLKSFYYLNLASRKLEKIEQLGLDEDGTVTNRTVFDRKSLK